MSEIFRPGDAVIAHYAPTDKPWLSGWYKAIVVRVGNDSTYHVRWEVNRNVSFKFPLTSWIDEDEIKRRSERGSYSGF